MPPSRPGPTASTSSPRPSSTCSTVLDRVADEVRVLDIDGRRGFRYESLYFDTPEFDSYLGAARRRPDRFKVRTRRYLDADGCWIEVKLRNRHGQTVKHRHPHEAAEFGQLSPGSLAFVSSFPRLRDLAHRLEPAMTTRYQRSTLLIGDARATIDVGVTAPTATGHRRSRRRRDRRDEERGRTEPGGSRALGPARAAGGDQQVLPRRRRAAPRAALEQVAPHPALPRPHVPG